MRPSSRQYVIWLCRASLAAFCLCASTNSSWSAEQLIDEAMINKWKAYERFARSLQGTARITAESSGTDAARERRIQIVLKQNQNCISVRRSLEGQPNDLINIANPQYDVDLRRNKSNPSEVVLARFHESHQRPRGGGESVFDQALPIFSPHFYVADTKIPLSQILVDPRFKILKMSKTAENGRELVRMDFRAVLDESSGRRTVSTGWIDLDPSHCWFIFRMKYMTEVTYKGARTMNSELEIEREMVNHLSGFPLVKRSTSRVKQHNYGDKNRKEERINSRVAVDYEWEVNDHFPDSEFTLTAYGLPEPGSEPVKKSIPWFVWIAVAAGICAVLAVGLRYLARRRALSHQSV